MLVKLTEEELCYEARVKKSNCESTQITLQVETYGVVLLQIHI